MLWNLLQVLFILRASHALSSTSEMGRHLLSKARRLNNNNNDDAYDFSWVTSYSIKFQSCHTTMSFRADGGGGSGDEKDGSPTELERLVMFKLCPTDKCSTCQGGAEYLVEMREFVESFLESKMSQQEYNCEKVKDNCDCDNYNDDDVCLSACYANAGLDYCEENNNDDGDDFEIDRYLECRDLDGGDDDSAQNIYVGAYCSSNGQNIYLGTFSDRQCSQQISSSSYKTLTGYALPYTSTSIVDNKCISCKEPSQYDDDAYNNADEQDGDQVTEFCEDLYDRAAKCESKLSSSVTSVKSTGGCDYIHNTLPRMERLARNKASPTTVLMWFFLCTTIVASGAAFTFYKYAKRTHGVALMSQGGESA